MTFEINPEFRRNLWLQFGWQRLAAALIVGVTMAYAIYIIGGLDRLSYAANLAAAIILGMWGPRRAADALAEEVAGGTWEAQRMSGLSAWAMSWGKLVGGSAFVWYCGLLAMGIFVFAGIKLGMPPGRAGSFWLGIYLTVMAAALGHAVALGIALILLRKAVQYRRLTITLAQTLGFLVFLAMSGVGTARVLNPDSFTPRIGYVFEAAYSWPLIRAVLGTVLLIWAIVAVFRLMRSELQYRAWPWVWLLFLIFCAVLGAGIAPWPDSGLIGGSITVFAVMVVLTYVAALSDRRDPIRYRSGMMALRRGDIARGLVELPWWVVSYAAVLIAATVTIAALASLPRDGLPTSLLEFALRFDLFVSYEDLDTSALMLPLFVLRDLMVLLWLSFGPWRQRADMTWLVYLALVYWPIGIILTFAGYFDYISVVLPVAGDNLLLSFGPILLQLALIFVMLRLRWLEATRGSIAQRLPKPAGKQLSRVDIGLPKLP